MDLYKGIHCQLQIFLIYLDRVPVHHSFHQQSIGWSPHSPCPTTVGVSRATLTVTVVDCPLFHLFSPHVGHLIGAWPPHTWELGLKLCQDLVLEVPSSLSLIVLKHQKVPLLHGELWPGHLCLCISEKKSVQELFLNQCVCVCCTFVCLFVLNPATTAVRV